MKTLTPAIHKATALAALSSFVLSPVGVASVGATAIGFTSALAPSVAFAQTPPPNSPPRPIVPPNIGSKRPGNLTGPGGAPPKVEGTSVLAGSGSGGGAKDSEMKAAAKTGRFHFDFNKAPITDIVKLISEITQKNFIIAEKVKGQQLTIMCPKAVTQDEAYKAFLSALEANDITLVKAGAFYKLIQSQDAAKNPIPTFVGNKEEVPPTDQMVTKLMRLQHADANGISQILKTFASKYAQIAVYQPTNSLIISEYGSNLVRLEDLLTNLDTEGSNDQIHLLKVQYAAATDMAQRLTELFDVKKAAGKSGSPTPPPAAGGPGGSNVADETLSISKLIADERTNQLIVVANEYAFKQIKDIMSKLDVPVGEETGQVRVISLQNANAEDLASVLSSLAQGASGTKKGKAAPGAPPPAPAAGAGGQSATLFEGEVKITADKATNSLVVIASPRDFRSLKRMVEQLDLPRRQVFVELAIMEVTNSDTLNVGTQWYSGVAAGSGAPEGLRNGVGVINSPASGNGGLITQAINPATLLGAFGGALAGFAGTPINIPGPNNTSISLPSFAILLRALQESSNANVISTPYLLATDNEESVIEVGQKIPFASGVGGFGGGGLGGLAGLAGGLTGGNTAGIGSALSGLGGLGGLGLGTQIQRIDVSLKISMTPHINDSDRVMIELDQTLEDLIDEKPINGVPIPVTAKRQVKSKVVVEDQQTIVLGGLIRDTIKESVTRYPLLGDIPILGWLFKTKRTTKDKSNLFLVLTPYIIRQRADYQRIYERKQKEYRSFVDMFYSNNKEYRATIDFSHKNGPLALLSKQVNKELDKTENGGKTEGDVVVVPGTATETINDPTQKTAPKSEESAAPKAQAAPPAEPPTVSPASATPVAPAATPAAPAAESSRDSDKPATSTDGD